MCIQISFTKKIPLIFRNASLKPFLVTRSHSQLNLVDIIHWHTYIKIFLILDRNENETNRIKCFFIYHTPQMTTIWLDKVVRFVTINKLYQKFIKYSFDPIINVVLIKSCDTISFLSRKYVYTRQDPSQCSYQISVLNKLSDSPESQYFNTSQSFDDRYVVQISSPKIRRKIINSSEIIKFYESGIINQIDSVIQPRVCDILKLKLS